MAKSPTTRTPRAKAAPAAAATPATPPAPASEQTPPTPPAAETPPTPPVAPAAEPSAPAAAIKMLVGQEGPGLSRMPGQVLTIGTDIDEAEAGRLVDALFAQVA